MLSLSIFVPQDTAVEFEANCQTRSLFCSSVHLYHLIQKKKGLAVFFQTCIISQMLFGLLKMLQSNNLESDCNSNIFDMIAR